MNVPEATVACTQLGYDSNGHIVALSGVPHNSTAYSRMKYGSRRYARELGILLGSAIVRQSTDLIKTQRVTAVCTYKTVPLAATILTDVVVSVINQFRYNNGLEPVERVHVAMEKLLPVDYSRLDVSGRKKYIADTGYVLPPGSVEDTVVVVIDDIKVTGGAEQLIRDLLKDRGHVGVVWGYLATMDLSTSVKGAEAPSVEYQINTTGVKGFGDLLDIIENDGMIITLRTLKMIMEETDKQKVIEFLETISLNTLFDLYDGVLSNGLHYLSYYKEGFETIKQVAVKRGVAATEGMLL